MPSPSTAPLRIAVLGASGIGKYHVREFAAAGADVVAILGSSAETAAQTASRLKADFEIHGVDPRPVANLEELLAQDLDAISIATPHELHYEACLRALLAGLFVFCEKPLFWEAELGDNQARAMLAELSMAGADERLCVNTSNASFIRALSANDLLPNSPNEFRFSLSTQGLDEGLEIGIDLLPHALSLLSEWLELTGNGFHAELAESVTTTSPHCFETTFQLRGLSSRPFQVACNFKLEERPRANKRMHFAFNGLEFERIQETDASGHYRVSLKSERGGLEVDDPFENYIRRFVAAIRSNSPLPVSFATSSRILLHSIELIRSARNAK